MYNPNAEITDTPRRTSGQGSDFSFLTELEADDELRKLRYLATDADNKQIEQLGDLNAKRSFLGNFWTGWLYGAGMKISGIFLLNAGLVVATGLVVWLAGAGKKQGDIGTGKPIR